MQAVASSSTVQAGDAVFVHLTIYLEDGSIADSTKATGKPSKIQLGDDSISLAMEQQLLGLTVGETKKFVLEADDAFGASQPDLVQFMDLHEFPADLELKEGLLISFDQPSGGTLPGMVREVQGHSVKVDFNHPLAGHRVAFEVELLSINEPPAKLDKE